MSRRFDRIMLAQRTCRSRTTRRLSDGEFRAFIACLCLAGQSPRRGYLLVDEGEPITPADIADEAGGDVDDDVALSAVEKLVRFGVLEVASSTPRCWRFVNWADFNPAPKASETPEAWRERKRRQRARQRKARNGGAK